MTSAPTRPLRADTRVRIAPSVYARAFGPEIVVLDFGRGEYFGLDAIGAEVWRGIEAGEALGAIAERLVQRYEVSHDDALHDIVDLVTHMRDNALVTDD